MYKLFTKRILTSLILVLVLLLATITLTIGPAFANSSDGTACPAELNPVEVDVSDAAPKNTYDGGLGTYNNPYEIANWSQLITAINEFNSGVVDGTARTGIIYFKLTNRSNITASTLPTLTGTSSLYGFVLSNDSSYKLVFENDACFDVQCGYFELANVVIETHEVTPIISDTADTEVNLTGVDIEAYDAPILNVGKIKKLSISDSSDFQGGVGGDYSFISNADYTEIIDSNLHNDYGATYLGGKTVVVTTSHIYGVNETSFGGTPVAISLYLDADNAYINAVEFYYALYVNCANLAVNCILSNLTVGNCYISSSTKSLGSVPRVYIENSVSPTIQNNNTSLVQSL